MQLIDSPLIGVVNALLLRGDLSIHALQQEISFDELLVMLKDFLQRAVTKASTLPSNESKIANTLQNFQDLIPLLPKLEQGLGTLLSTRGMSWTSAFDSLLQG